MKNDPVATLGFQGGSFSAVDDTQWSFGYRDFQLTVTPTDIPSVGATRLVCGARGLSVQARSRLASHPVIRRHRRVCREEATGSYLPTLPTSLHWPTRSLSASLPLRASALLT